MDHLVTLRTVLVAFSVWLAATPAWSQQNQVLRQVESLPWQAQPSVARLGTIAQISLAGTLRSLDAASTRTFLQLNGNPPRDNEYTIAPRSLNWFAVFSFDPSGYVRDDEQLDPDELLKTLRRQNADSIEERRRLHLPLLRLDGWGVPPHYDVQTHRLEWGTRLINEADGSVTINYLVRVLGRSGTMSGILVSSPEELSTDIEQFHAAMRGFSFVQGEKYAEFRQGDHVAEYGLAALVVGGAAAAAASSGAMKGLGKLLGVGVLAVFAAVGGFFKRLFAKRKTS
jgi:uncharacterized membrane-anchored protein